MHLRGLTLVTLLGGILQGNGISNFSQPPAGGKETISIWSQLAWLKNLKSSINQNMQLIRNNIQEVINKVSGVSHKVNEMETALDDRLNAFENLLKFSMATKNVKLQVCRREMGVSSSRYTPHLVYAFMPDPKVDSEIVLCDDKTDGGGWVVFQRRINGNTNFARTWDEYKFGFGSLKNNFWLGNDKLAQLTGQGDYELRIDMEIKGNRYYAHYATFRVRDETDNFRLEIGKFSGNTIDSMSFNNRMQFTTTDRDNDIFSEDNCARLLSGGWWYASCSFSNLNGNNWGGGSTTKGPWWTINEEGRNMLGVVSFSQMMVRRKEED